MKIGFLGLGKMGAAIAANLVAAGQEVVVWNRTRERAVDLVAAGARLAPSVSDAADADVVVTMLTDDAAVEQLAFGEAGVVAGRAPIHISMSTISVELAGRLDRAHRDRGTMLISAPVFGRPAAAQAARLAIVAAGPKKGIDICRPLFGAMGDRFFVVGERPSAANLIKLCINFMGIAAIEAMAEAATLARKGGVANDVFFDIVTTIFPSPVHQTYASLLQERAFTPPGFAAALGLKDVELMGAAATRLRSPLPLLAPIHDHLLSLLAQEGDDVDWSAILLPIERAAGIPPSLIEP